MKDIDYYARVNDEIENKNTNYIDTNNNWIFLLIGGLLLLLIFFGNNTKKINESVKDISKTIKSNIPKPNIPKPNIPKPNISKPNIPKPKMKSNIQSGGNINLLNDLKKINNMLDF